MKALKGRAAARVGEAAKVGTNLGSGLVGLLRMPIVLTLSLAGVVLGSLAFAVTNAKRAVEKTGEEPEAPQAKRQQRQRPEDGRPGSEGSEAEDRPARRGFFRRTSRG